MIITPSQLRYSCYSSNVPGLHIILWVELLTPFTSELPFLLCSSFVSTLLIRKRRLVVLLFCSIVLRSQTYLRSKTFHFWLLCFLCPITILLSFLSLDTFIPMDTYTNKSCMIGSVCISTIVHPFARTSSLLRLLCLLQCTPEYLHKLRELHYSKIRDNAIVRGRNT